MVLAYRRKSPMRKRAAKRPPATRMNVRSRLLRAADEILVGEGIRALTQTRVAEAAGLRQSHLTYYFATRSTLINAVFRYIAGNLVEEFSRDAGNMGVSLADLRRGLMDVFSDQKTARRMMGMLVSIDEDPKLIAALEEIEVRHCAALASAIRRLGVRLSEQHVLLLHSSLIGIVMRFCNRNSAAQRQQARALIGEAFDRATAPARVAVRQARTPSSAARTHR
jgi:AcrR family transcriptional regulator